jgi:hypothetical protein
MAQDATNVAAAAPLATSGVLYAPTGTTIPVSSDATLDVAFKGLGYVADNGVESSGDAASITDIKAWGGDIVASLTETKAIKRFTFSLIEVFSQTANEFIYGTGNVTLTAAGGGNGTRLAIEDTATDPVACVLVFDMKHGDKRVRLVVPNAQVTILSERAYVDNDVMGWECQATAVADENGVYVYRYLENDDAVA